MINIRLKRRIYSLGISRAFIPIFAVLLALCLGAILFLISGVNPFRAYLDMLKGSFGTFYNFSEVIVRATPLIFCALSVGIAGKMQLWNIGAEGQLVAGGIAGMGAGLFLASGLNPWAGIVVMLLAGILGGGVWGLISGILRAKWNVSEIITTLMLNYVAIIWMEHLYFGPWRDPAGRGFPGTAMLSDTLRLPRFWGTRIHAGFFLALFAAVLIWAVLKYTKWGYQVRVIGESREAARYARFPIGRNILIVMFLSGGLAGLSGISEIAGIHFRLQQGLAVGDGYVGIIVAWLASLDPLLSVVIAILLGALMVGGDQLQITMHIPSSIGLLLEGMILFCVIGGKVFQHYTLSLKRGEKV
ncbi:MAG: ABC transporter permease [Nitrospiraceae bacterium]|nr:ABC transporter permease [Nitrospiraceae bacterium]